MQKLKLALFIATIFTFLYSCKTETILPKDVDSESTSLITNSNNQFSNFDKPSQSLKKKLVKSASVPNNVPGCTVQKHTQSATFDRMSLLDPTSDVMYIGSLLKGESIQEGEYTPFFLPPTYEMKPVTFSVSIQNSGGTITKTIDPRLSNFRVAMQEITNAPIVGEQPANFTFEVKQARSMSEIEMSIGANLKFGSIFSSFANFQESTNSTKNYYLLKIIQKFFTANIDIPSDGNLFKKPAYFQNGIAPVYISSIEYGRSAYLLLESSYDSTRVHQSLNATFSLWKVYAGANLSQEHKSVMEDLKISGTVIGGSSTQAVKTITGIQGFKDYVINSGNLTPDSPGEIIAYRLRNAADHSIYQTMISGDFYTRDCSSLLLPFHRYYGGHNHFYTIAPENEDLRGYAYEGYEGKLYRSQVPNTVSQILQWEKSLFCKGLC